MCTPLSSPMHVSQDGLAIFMWRRLACCCSPVHFSTGGGWDVDAGDAGPDRRQIWIVARQHPGESMAEWFMEGAHPVAVNAEVSVLQSPLDFAICLSTNKQRGVSQPVWISVGAMFAATDKLHACYAGHTCMLLLPKMTLSVIRDFEPSGRLLDVIILAYVGEAQA